MNSGNITLHILDEEDKQLVKKAREFLKRHYKKNKHHAACILKDSDDKEYYALQLDVRGFDVCAEPIALSHALLDKKGDMAKIIAVVQAEASKIKVANPCGNCRQMLLQHAPDIEVILNTKRGLFKARICDLLSVPY